MKKIILIIVLSSSFFTNLFAQLPNRQPGEWYSTTGFELIFSGAKVQNLYSIQPTNVVRFSVFPDIAWDANYDFNSTFGFYFGWDIRNIGFINKFHVPVDTASIPTFDDVTIKQRSYDLGIPIAFKIGNLTKDNYIAIGTEWEWMFAFKEKAIFNGTKEIAYIWGSGQANPFNQSVFVEFHNQHGGYIRFKSYLKDFLKNEDMTFVIPNTTQTVNYQPTSSKLFYLSIGTAIRSKRLRNHHADKNDV